jgi:hypothetical protein
MAFFCTLLLGSSSRTDLVVSEGKIKCVKEYLIMFLVSERAVQSHLKDSWARITHKVT